MTTVHQEGAVRPKPDMSKNEDRKLKQLQVCIFFLTSAMIYGTANSFYLFLLSGFLPGKEKEDGPGV